MWEKISHGNSFYELKSSIQVETPDNHRVGDSTQNKGQTAHIYFSMKSLEI